MFQISVTTTIGDGKATLFWTDRWLHGKAIPDLAPALMQHVRRRGWRKLTVHDALQDNHWFTYIMGGLSVLAQWQFLQLCDIVHEINISPEEQDRHIWSPHPSGTFTTKSAYERFFTGAVPFEPHRRLWKT